jgi:hypothetical protein
MGATSTIDGDCLTVNGSANVSFRIARWWHDGCESHAPHWSIERKRQLSPGWIIAIRLAEKNNTLHDYLLLPTTSVTRPTLRFTENARKRHKVERFDDFSALVRSFMRSLGPRAPLGSDHLPEVSDCQFTKHVSTSRARRRRQSKAH